ncbi:MAG: hypothetical protein ACLQGP_01260 [Isosphaeraceae bacterium]
MSDEPKIKPGAEPPIDLDLRTRDPNEPLTLEMKRFDIFLIDSGWNRPISKTVRSHLRLLFEFHRHDSLYELTPQQSLEILKQDPALIGCDPTIIVYDRYGCSRTDVGSYCGFRLNLGLMKNTEQALARLQEFIRFIATNRTAERLDREIRRELHREGVDGIVKLLRETSTELLME